MKSDTQLYSPLLYAELISFLSKTKSSICLQSIWFLIPPSSLSLVKYFIFIQNASFNTMLSSYFAISSRKVILLEKTMHHRLIIKIPPNLFMFLPHFLLKSMTYCVIYQCHMWWRQFDIYVLPMWIWFMLRYLYLSLYVLKPFQTVCFIHDAIKMFYHV